MRLKNNMCTLYEHLLSIIQREQKYYFIFHLSQLISLSHNTWIGLTDEAQESDFRWVNGAPLYYQKFTNSEPNGKRNENCAVMIMTVADLGGSRQENILCSSLGLYVEIVTFRFF